jgi:hypothetical protein
VVKENTLKMNESSLNQLYISIYFCDEEVKMAWQKGMKSVKKSCELQMTRGQATPPLKK